MNWYENDLQFRHSFSSPNLYLKTSSQDLRYLSYFYSEHRAAEERDLSGPSLNEAMGGDYHVEDIWLQIPKEPPIKEAGDYPSSEERYAAFTDYLGNLTLASGSWNSEWRNCDFKTKRNEGVD